MDLLCIVLLSYPSQIPEGNIEFTIQVGNLSSTVYSQEDKRELVDKLCTYRELSDVGKDEVLVAKK